MNYRLITDATADMDMPPCGADVLCMGVTIDGEPFSYGPGGNITADEFYDKLRSGAKASTSQIPPREFVDRFKPILAGGEDILYLCFSSALSGTYQSACIAAEELRESFPDRKIEVVDTLSASIREGFLVREACRRYSEGMELDHLVKWISENNRKIDCQFTVDDLESLRAGGRISRTAAVLGGALQIKPMLGINKEGALELTGKVRGRKKSIETLFMYYADRHDDNSRDIMIGHASAPNDAKTLCDMIRSKFPKAEPVICDIGPIIGVHTGVGMLSVCFYKDGEIKE